jgi:hypothetical protein
MEDLPLFGKNANLVQLSGRFLVTIGAIFFVVCAWFFYPWSALLLDGHATGTVVGRFQTYGRYPSHQVISQGINYRFVDENENSHVGSGVVTRDFYESVRANAQVEIRYWRVFPIINLLAATAHTSVLTIVLGILTLALGAYSVWTGRQILKTAYCHGSLAANGSKVVRWKTQKREAESGLSFGRFETTVRSVLAVIEGALNRI